MAAPTVAEAPAGDAQRADGPPTFHLVVMGPDYTATHQLPPSGTLTVGRAEDAQVRIADQLASRYHARLYVGAEFAIEDLGSANGTLVRDQPVEPQRRVTVAPGETINVGSTILVIQRREPGVKTSRVRPHGHFEARLIEECGRAESVHGTFAVVRLHVDQAPAAARAGDLIAATLRPGDVLAAYGPHEYEIILVDSGRDASDVLVAQIVHVLACEEIKARAGLAFFPKDGASPQALVAFACALVRGGAQHVAAPDGFVVDNPAMRALYATAERVAAGNINVLILGETGAGKEILAQTIHRRSKRAGGPFVGFNCAAFTESLLDSELFGYERGAFTGAAQARPGLLESASGGTVFLDEVGEMSIASQVKLLRVLETREVRRVGANADRAIDVRFVAATNRDLDEEIAAKRFREDLFFRLNGMTLTIPPLRERLDEIEPLARLFLERVAEEAGQAPPAISAAAAQYLRAYAWPGNIRELKNVIERAFLLCGGAEITPEHIETERMHKLPLAAPVSPAELPHEVSPAATAQAAPGAVAGTWREIERQAILDALERCAGSQTRAAELLGMPRRTFCTRLKEYSIRRPRS